MVRFTIEELPIPTEPGASGWADFAASLDLQNAVEAEGYGTDELAFTPKELLPGYHHQQYDPRRLFVARVGDAIVAGARTDAQAEGGDDCVWLSFSVHRDWRRRGIGTALAAHVEGIAAAEGRSTQYLYTVSPDAPGPRLAAPTGFGSVPRENPEVRFLLGRGYHLEQIERGSRLALPLDPTALAEQLGTVSSDAGPGYVVQVWEGATPERWRTDIAVLYTRMSTDAPSAGLNEPEDVWSVDRLVSYEQKHEASPRTLLTAAVEHRSSERLVGFTELSVPPELHRSVSQESTLVLSEHRGHGLGMLVKLANLRQLADRHPGHPAVTTFNAEENRHMLRVNEQLGFVPMGYEGAWKRVARV
ncbi:GNAT family N-acetyltransferase [Leifsonia kafniensis]